MAKKKLAAIVKIQIPAGKASPAPPVGTALGPHGVAIMDFVKQYNAATESQTGTIIPVEINVYEDRTFDFVLKTPPTPVLIRQKAGIEKAASIPGKEVAGSITEADVDRDRDDQDARPQRLRPRSRQAPGARHRPLDGHQGRPLARRTDCQQKQPAHNRMRAPRSPRSGRSIPRETSHVRQEAH